MRKLITIISSLVFIITIFVSVNTFAEYEDDNTGLYKFESIMIYFAVSYDNGENYTVLYDDADGTTIDLAAPDGPSETIGSFLSGQQIPAGTITNIKVRFPWNETVNGWVRDTDTDTIYVTDSSVAWHTTEWTGEENPTSADCDDITLPAPDDGGDYNECTETVSLTVAEGGTLNIAIVFDLGAVLTTMEIGDHIEIVPSDDSRPEISQI